MTWGMFGGRRAAVYAGLAAMAVGLGVGGRCVAWRAFAPATPPKIATGPGLGAVMVCGGGALPEDVRGRFLDLAGGRGAKLVVIPTAHAAADAPEAEAIYLKPWRDLGVRNVKLFHTRSRSQADDPAFCRPLAEASGVWISGGKQAMLADSYVGTEVERQLQGVVRRGGVVAGTSAGAAILTRVMIVSGRSEAKEGRGFDFLPGAVVDQHFLRRKRVNRLLDILNRHRDLIGFGVDEGTALLFRGGRLNVLGDSYVVACLPGEEGKPPRMEYLKKGDEADFASLKGPSPAIVSTQNLDDVLTSEQ